MFRSRPASAGRTAHEQILHTRANSPASFPRIASQETSVVLWPTNSTSCSEAVQAKLADSEAMLGHQVADRQAHGEICRGAIPHYSRTAGLPLKGNRCTVVSSVGKPWSSIQAQAVLQTLRLLHYSDNGAARPRQPVPSNLSAGVWRKGTGCHNRLSLQCSDLIVRVRCTSFCECASPLSLTNREHTKARLTLFLLEAGG